MAEQICYRPLGLYTKSLSGRGLCVTGLDFSECSIAYAKQYDSKSIYKIIFKMELKSLSEEIQLHRLIPVIITLMLKVSHAKKTRRPYAW